MSDSTPDVAAATALVMEAFQGQETAPETSPAEQAVEAAPTTEPSSEGTTSEEDSFTALDPNTLPDELKPLHKSLQGAWTRKTQELAEIRKTYEGLGDLGKVQTAVEFANRLESDPAFQQQVYQALAQRFQGLQSQPTENNPTYEDDEDAITLPPEFQHKLTTLEQKLAQIEAERYQMFYQNEMLAQEQQVRRNHPEWTDDDIKYLYDLAPAHEGNLTNAARALEAIQERTIAQYWNSKQKAPAPALPTSAAAQVPTAGFKTMDEAKAAAIQLVQNAWADQ